MVKNRLHRFIMSSDPKGNLKDSERRKGVLVQNNNIGNRFKRIHLVETSMHGMRDSMYHSHLRTINSLLSLRSTLIRSVLPKMTVFFQLLKSRKSRKSLIKKCSLKLHPQKGSSVFRKRPIGMSNLLEWPLTTMKESIKNTGSFLTNLQIIRPFYHMDIQLGKYQS